ncbi:MAG TPA: hypothetical protein PLI05_04105, partial [Methanotrichaceae archaeon]|nr:hypothetical protein [Methanotrichaceae archaeon]HQI90009.1 hypothetical protein [Methanotrichaceae archaeon]HQJ27967.1 hypothetical protein [Methanotrichaceae archaeon]
WISGGYALDLWRICFGSLEEIGPSGSRRPHWHRKKNLDNGEITTASEQSGAPRPAGRNKRSIISNELLSNYGHMLEEGRKLIKHHNSYNYGTGNEGAGVDLQPSVLQLVTSASELVAITFSNYNNFHQLLWLNVRR